MIDSFRGEYGFLSNFAWCKIKYKGVIYKTVEHAYQAAKTLDKKRKQLISEAPTPGAAKRWGRNVEIREDWEEIKLDIMLALVRQKFTIPELKKKLLATGKEKLIEGNWWGDTFWGVCKDEGENHLGRILMRVREELKRKEG